MSVPAVCAPCKGNYGGLTVGAWGSALCHDLTIGMQQRGEKDMQLDQIKINSLEKKRGGTRSSKNERPEGKKVSNHDAHVSGRGLVRVVLRHEQKIAKMSHLTTFPVTQSC